jgi:hypothetical protein
MKPKDEGTYDFFMIEIYALVMRHKAHTANKTFNRPETKGDQN